jgi:hypothetical protein
LTATITTRLSVGLTYAEHHTGAPVPVPVPPLGNSVAETRTNPFRTNLL